MFSCCCLKILFNGNQAVGVEYERNGTVQQIKARKEIILCAGVFGSPHILLLSGVGPKAHLENMSVSHLWCYRMSKSNVKCSAH